VRRSFFFIFFFSTFVPEVYFRSFKARSLRLVLLFPTRPAPHEHDERNPYKKNEKKINNRYTVMLSNYRRYFKLAAYLSTFTQEAIVIAMGVPTLRELFKEKHYADLDGGLLEGFGRLLKFDLKVYVYPTVDPKTGTLVTASDMKVEDPGVQKLYDYILERGAIVPVEHYDRELLRHGDVSKLVAESIRSGTDEWEALVPHHVRDQVKRLNLLGYRGSRDEDSEGSGSGGSGGSGGESSDGGSSRTTTGAGTRSGNGAPKSKAKAAPAA
jgi:uncharacterized membrane protein YgcG